MTVRELMAQLQAANPDALVVMSSDGEGNSYSPLADVVTENRVYGAQTTWVGEVFPAKLTPDLDAMGFSDEDMGAPGLPECVVLWPTN